MGVVLGIDGGGTKTRCLVADRAGRLLGEGLAGPSNYQVVGVEAAAAAVMGAAGEALARAGIAGGGALVRVGRAGDEALVGIDGGEAPVGVGIDAGQVEAVCAGLAGVGRPEDQAAMLGALESRFAPATVTVVPDARIALAGALGGKPGVVVISGTGSIAFGLDAAGQTVRAGGWGWILGDEGSGYDIGRRAVAAALAALDGTGEPTGLTERICAAWQLERMDQAIRRVYADVLQAKAEMAALVPLVIDAADAGDVVAAGLLIQAGLDLGKLAGAVLRRLGLRGQVPVVVTGGVLSGCAAVRDAMAGALVAAAPGAVLIESIEGPAEGAVRLALDSIRRLKP